MSANIDMESGETNPNPMNMMHENPELRWSFSRKVYSIITFQLLLTIAFTSVVTFVPPVANFINSKQGNILCTVLFFVPFIILCPLYYYHLKYPLNYFFFLIFNVSLAIVFGFACGIASGNIQILEVAILTTVMMFILILYTFWAAKRGHDFSYLGSFLSGSLSVLILLGLIQILSPLGKLSHMIFGCFISIIFCGTNYIIIKEYTYDHYIMAFFYLFTDVFCFIMILLFCYV
ncbi:hypothetical protein P8452_00291 [Trifolium repens]|nr:hypothetical protein P8452_00291 [Trifolium repens]